VAIATIGYVIYGIGAIIPYLRERLALSDAVLGLHSTALAVGLVVVGAFAAGLDRRIGEVAVRGLAIAGLVIAVIGLAIAPAVGVTLAGAGLVGMGVGTLLGYANAVLARPGGRAARVRVARANVWSMVTAFACPVLLAAAVTAGLPFGLGLVPALGLLAALAWDLRAGPRLEPAAGATPEGARSAATGSLPRPYWLAWAFLVAAIAVEFSIVVWGATLIERRAGAETAAATLLAGLFLGGMFTGRLVQSVGIGTGRRVRRAAGFGVGLAILGSLIAWVSTVPIVSGIGLFVAGTGIAGLYPLGVAAALGAAPHQLTLAGTRLTLASGTAVLAAPLALGAIADAAGVVAGWGLVVAMAVVALILVIGLPTGAATPASPATATDLGPAGMEETGSETLP
jgi:MFS family permease